MPQPVSSSLVRFEVEVPEGDAGLIKRAVAALVDPDRRVQARRSLRQTFSNDGALTEESSRRSAPDLKALLTSPLLQGLDLERVRDDGRDVDL